MEEVKVEDDVIYLSAEEEDAQMIAQANSPLLRIKKEPSNQ